MKVISIGQDESSKFDEEISMRPAFVKFYMPECGYCKAMKEAWDNLGKEMMNDTREMSIIEVHSGAVNNIKSNVTKEVNGYPTIMLVYNKGNSHISYECDRDRSTSDMKKFINDNFEKINGMSGGSKSRITKSKSKSRRTKSKSRRYKPKSRRTKSRRTKSRRTKSRRTKSKSRRTKSRRYKPRK